MLTLKNLGRALGVCCGMAVLVILGGCEGKGPDALLGDMVRNIRNPTPAEAARDAFNVYDPDKRRQSIALLANAEWGGQAPYLKTYRLLADDPDPTVRAASLSALGRHGDRSDVPTITRYLRTDESKIVRWEAAKALQRISDERAIDPLIEALSEDEDRDVRMASANALGQYPDRRVYDALVGALDDTNYGVVRESATALATLTGEDFGDSSEKWWNWARGNGQIFASRQAYAYPEYDRPASLWSRVKFWEGDGPPPPSPADETMSSPAEVAVSPVPRPRPVEKQPVKKPDKPTKVDEPKKPEKPKKEKPKKPKKEKPKKEPTWPKRDRPDNTGPQPPKVIFDGNLGASG